MSPEHLQSVRARMPGTDARSDIYALGILLFEMLTGQYPFRFPKGSVDDELPRMIAERQAAPPRLRQLNSAVSPGLEAIVRKCLEADPAIRYQSAAELREELERHRSGLPLKQTRVPSVRERLQKWARRHPRLSSNLTVGIAAVILIGLCVAGLYSRGQRLERYEAETISRQFDGDFREAHYLLSSRIPETRTVDRGVASAQVALARYGLPGDREWDKRSQFRVLPVDEQQKVRTQLSEACLLLARGYTLQAKPGTESEARLTDALQMNELAERIRGDYAPRALWEQRSELFRRLGNSAEAERSAARAREAVLETARDFYLSGSEAVAEGRYREAIRLLRRAAELDPAQFWTHLSLGVCYESLGLPKEAVGYYTTAIALWPDYSKGYYNRGLAALRAGDYPRAKADLDKAEEMMPESVDVYLYRALAHQGLRQYDAAIRDLDRAIERGTPLTRALLMRSRVRDLAGDKEGAKKDLAEGMKQEPTDDLGWSSRGTARISTDPEGAVKDFDAALALNPRALAAMQNRASALSKLGRHQEAIQTFNKLLELYPDYVPGRIGRGVQHAREGNWQAAVTDAQDALRRDPSPATTYQAANIHALLYRSRPEHKADAIRMLTAALRAGFGFDFVETDKDLDPIRDTAEFKRVLEAVRSLKAEPAARQ